MEHQLDQIDSEARRDLEASAGDSQKLEALSVKYLGRKGVLTQFLRSIASLPPEDRPAAGQRANAIKQRLAADIAATLEALATAGRSATPPIDVSLPGRSHLCGALHPITQISRQICDIFSGMGFDIVEGPEVENDYYNFEALNIPPYHPARDMQDTFSSTSRPSTW